MDIPSLKNVGLCLGAILLWAASSPSILAQDDGRVERLLRESEQTSWNLAFEYSSSEDWRDDWFLDGLKAEVKPGDGGFLFVAGSVAHDDASHAVLWTRRSFEGDLKIEYDYTRLDTVDQCVNIIYIHATGKGSGPYHEDIYTWKDLREIPAMSQYFNNMNALHISYAAHFMEADDRSEYVHARLYPVPEGGWFSHTSIGEQVRVDRFLFPGRTYEITILKMGDRLLFSAQEKGTEIRHGFIWDTSGFEPVERGRVGLRHMWTRAARYGNFRISQASSGVDQ